MPFRLTLACILLSSRIFAADQFDGVRDFIRACMAERKAPSITVPVARDEKIIWEEGFGWADREKRIPATAHTVCFIARSPKHLRQLPS